MKNTKPQALKHAMGDDRAVLEQLIEALELRSELHHQQGELVSAAELMQITRYLRQLCPPTSHVHNRAWSNGDLFPVAAAP
jgi:hypothetical protein